MSKSLAREMHFTILPTVQSIIKPDFQEQKNQSNHQKQL